MTRGRYAIGLIRIAHHREVLDALRETNLPDTAPQLQHANRALALARAQMDALHARSREAESFRSKFVCEFLLQPNLASLSSALALPSSLGACLPAAVAMALPLAALRENRGKAAALALVVAYACGALLYHDADTRDDAAAQQGDDGDETLDTFFRAMTAFPLVTFGFAAGCGGRAHIAGLPSSVSRRDTSAFFQHEP